LSINIKTFASISRKLLSDIHTMYMLMRAFKWGCIWWP